MSDDKKISLCYDRRMRRTSFILCAALVLFSCADNDFDLSEENPYTIYEDEVNGITITETFPLPAGSGVRILDRSNNKPNKLKKNSYETKGCVNTLKTAGYEISLQYEIKFPKDEFTKLDIDMTAYSESHQIHHGAELHQSVSISSESKGAEVVIEPKEPSKSEELSSSEKTTNPKESTNDDEAQICGTIDISGLDSINLEFKFHSDSECTLSLYALFYAIIDDITLYDANGEQRHIIGKVKKDKND